MAVQAGVGGKSKTTTKKTYKAPVKAYKPSVKKPIQPAPPRVRPPSRPANYAQSQASKSLGRVIAAAKPGKAKTGNTLSKAAAKPVSFAQAQAKRSLATAIAASKPGKAKTGNSFSRAAAKPAVQAAFQAAAKKIAARPTTPSRPTTNAGPARPTTPTAPPKPPVAAPPKPPAAPVPPKPITTTGGPATAAQATTLSGRGAFGRFDRQRRGRGPTTGESLTPEQLQAIARQRIVNYH